MSTRMLCRLIEQSSVEVPKMLLDNSGMKLAKHAKII